VALAAAAKRQDRHKGRRVLNLPAVRRSSGLASVAGNTLVRLLEKDDHTLSETDGRSNGRALNCFSKHHHDDRISMRVDLKEGTFKCAHCGIQGNALSYLRQHREMSNDEAYVELRTTGWSLSMIEEADAQDKHTLGPGLQWVASIPDILPEESQSKKAEYIYRAGENIIMTRAIYTGLFDSLNKRQNSLTFCKAPSRGGGYWVCDPLDAALPQQDRFADAYPLYRMDDGLALWSQGGEEWIWLVSDEQVCEILHSLEGYMNGPSHCVSLYEGQHTRIEDHDLSPLVGKRVLLIANQDEPSRCYMRRLWHELSERGVKCEVCLQAGDTGDSIGNAIERKGTSGGSEWLQSAYIGDATKPLAVFSEVASASDIEHNSHFRILGMIGDSIAVRIKRTQRLHYVPMDLLSNEAHLLPLAPLNWWLRLAGAEARLSHEQRNWLSDQIMQLAAKEALFEIPDDPVGRGAFCYEAERRALVGYNNGDRLLLPDDDGLLTREASLDSLDLDLLPGRPLELHDDPNAEEYARALVESFAAYRWASPEHAKAFLGWIVTSIVGGALRFRPALWIAAGKGTGKTYLIDALDDLFGPLAMRYYQPMQPDARGLAYADCLPCLIDLLDRDRDDQEWEQITELVGQITRGRGRIARGGLPRCSFIFASRKMPPRVAVESQRLMILRLGRSVADWPDVDESIVEATRPYKMLALRTHIIRNALLIAAKARELEHYLLRSRADGTATREAQLVAALTAGYGFLSDDWEFIERKDEVVPDQNTVLGAVLNAHVETPRGEVYSIAQLLTSSDSRLTALAAKFGFKLVEHGNLAVARRCTLMTKLFIGTIFCTKDLDDYCMRIDAKAWNTANGNPGRINCGDTRYVCRLIPNERLNQVGFYP